MTLPFPRIPIRNYHTQGMQEAIAGLGIEQEIEVKEIGKTQIGLFLAKVKGK